ncbi:MAG: hypothetical protein KF819_12420 [Labilithrix sp.]|nr:hypothetical protein [Labilithrix sp.]
MLRHVALVTSLLAVACGASRPTPVSSASQPGYAMKYADAVAGTTKTIGERQTDAKQITSGFGARVDELKKPDWARVETVVERADESGRSAGYGEARAEWGAVHRFWTEERETIGGKVAGGVDYTAKEKGCNAELGGAAAYALKDAVDKQQEKRLRAKNEAFVVIERYATVLGKENTKVLEKLADDVARASWIVNVDLPEERERLKARVAEKSSVGKTLDGIVEDEKAFQAEPGRTDADKKASEERIAAATKQRAEVDKAAAQADEALQRLDAQIEDAKKDYAAALEALKAKIAEKKKTADKS